ncbi:MAG: phospholipase D family protein [archaeon]|jgi:phosphatidylserine/phosphatidylglycerophosphate/cardiolipin synthase-like enzyme
MNKLWFAPFVAFLLISIFVVFGCTQVKESVCGPESSGDSCADSSEVYFCPADDCANRLIEKIDAADETISIAIYSFTLDSVADALVRAKQRDVSIKVIFDNGQINESSEDGTLLGAGIPVKRKKGGGYMHNKFCVIDGEIVGTGSFNYSKNAQTENNENLIFISSKKIADAYQQEFDRLWQETG